MSIIKWSKDLCVGIDSIDEEHRQLAAIINELHLAVEYHGGGAAIYPVIHKLHDYAHTHFEAEGEVLERHGVRGMPDHVQEHKEFVQRLDELILRYRSNTDELTIHLRDFLLAWFFNHLSAHGVQYSQPSDRV